VRPSPGAAECERVFGGLDILVNNAGAIHPIGAAAETAPEAFEACLRVNVTGAFSLARAVWPLLKQSGGRIVNILSGASRQPLAGWSAYCASKSALLMLTRSLDLEGEPEGIRCFGFAPGLVDTKMQRAIRQSGVNEISRLSRSALTHPDIPAQAVAWLASGDADDLAGQYVDVRDPGWDNVDVGAAHACGNHVAHVPDYCLDEVADHTAALALALSRKLFVLDAAVRRGEWAPAKTAAPLKSPGQSVAGLVGVGRIGRKVLERLRPFGFRLLVADPALSESDAAQLDAEKCGYPDLLARSDVAIFNAPSTPQTRRMLNADALAAAKTGMMVVNCARGDLIDESALAAALESGQVGAAGLDVFATEPLPGDSPLRRAPNVVLTPHAAWFSDRAIANLQRLAADEVSRALRNEPPRKPVPAR